MLARAQYEQHLREMDAAGDDEDADLEVWDSVPPQINEEPEETDPDNESRDTPNTVTEKQRDPASPPIGTEVSTTGTKRRRQVIDPFAG
jgi:hypothetical protein